MIGEFLDRQNYCRDSVVVISRSPDELIGIIYSLGNLADFLDCALHHQAALIRQFARLLRNSAGLICIRGHIAEADGHPLQGQRLRGGGFACCFELTTTFPA